MTTTGLVLTGAAARGPFQAGALAELMPALAAQGQVPTVVLGTSAGAITAALWGGALHRGPTVAAEEAVAVWRGMSTDDVYRSLLPFWLPATGARYAAGAVLGVGTGTISLLDTAPLRRLAVDLLDTDRLAAAVSGGLLRALGVAATRLPAAAGSDPSGSVAGRSVLFLHTHQGPGGPDPAAAADPDRALDVALGPIRPEHVVASAAIPVAFPPVQVGEPMPAAGWYLDGGVRLNAPLRPALALGADRLVVVSATATTPAAPPGPDHARTSPDIADAAAQLLHTVLADRLVEDLATLARVNRLVRQAAAYALPGGLTDRHGRVYRVVEALVVSPPPGALAALAAEVYARRTRGLGRLRELDSWLVGSALRGAGDATGRRELLSYLLFDEEYAEASIEVGRQAARAALARGWRT